MSTKLSGSLISISSSGLIFALAMLFSSLTYAQPRAVFVGDSVAFHLWSQMMYDTRAVGAVGLSSRDIATRVIRNKDVQNIKWAIISAGTDEVANPNTKINFTSFEENLWTIREELKASEYVWVGAYDREVNRVVKNFAYTYGDWFVDLNDVGPPARYPDKFKEGIQPRNYFALLSFIHKTTREKFPAFSTK